jgi:putative nucleotidyltransferase with HDIG domain
MFVDTAEQEARGNPTNFCIRIENYLPDLQRLRPFPAVATKLLNLCNQQDANIRDIIQLIECEPAVASKVLSLANSPLYGTSRVSVTIGQAVVLLGYRAVAQVAVSVAAGGVFAQGSDDAARARRDLFTHCLGCGTVGRALAHVTQQCNPDEAFLCGILHDVGKLIFLDLAADDYLEFQNNVDGDSSSKIVAEQAAFGIDHTRTGNSCGTAWGLPAEISAAIADHHNADAGTSHPRLSTVTYEANCLAKHWGIGLPLPQDAASTARLLELYKSDELAEIEARARAQFDAVREICS